VTYIPRRYSSVSLLSSSHTTLDIDTTCEQRKPLMILHYNITKGGVDTFDKSIEEFTFRRKTSRWPLLIFFNTLDASAFNAFVLLRKNGYMKSRPDFLRNLTFELAKCHIEHRMTLQRTSRDARQCAITVGVHSPPGTISLPIPAKTGHCHVCRKTSRSHCEICGKPCCPTHRHALKITKCNLCAMMDS
jgi:hypothetical protein